jgi:hypothetical protein
MIIFLHSVPQLLLLLILFTEMMQAIYSSSYSVLTRATWRHITEDGILHSRRRENIKSYIESTDWAL